MKIAIFYNLAFGGAKRVVYEHVKGLRAEGHIVDVYTTDTSTDIFDPGKIADNCIVYPYTFHHIQLPFLNSLSRDFHTVTTLKKLHKKIANAIDAKKYDIVLVHTDRITQSPFILRFLKTKTVYFCLEPLRIAYEYSLRIPSTFHGISYVYEMLTRQIRKTIDRKNALSATYTTAISLFGRECMIYAYNLYPKISYLGVDTSIFKNISIKKKQQVLFIGQKEALNGYNYALQAMELIPEKIRPILKVVSLAKTDKERLSEKDIVKLYNESIVTLSLSTYDTFGLVTLESMACGTPVIAFNVAGYRETMVHGKTGYLVDFDSQEIANRIIELCQNPALAKKMGQYGQKFVTREWTWKKHIKILADILSHFVNKVEQRS